MPSPKRPYIITLLHWLVLTAAGGLIAWITRDTLAGVSFVDSAGFRSFQFWMCIIFQIDIIVEWRYAPRKLHYLRRNIFFILVSITYMSLIRLVNIR